METHRFQDISDLKRFWSQHRDLPPILLQNYVPGHGVGIEILLHRGKCLAAFQHRRLRELPYTGGVSVVAVAEAADPLLVERACELLQALQWEGVAMVEFKADPHTRKAVLMEVNGRFWGSLSLPIEAGIDFPFYVWQLAHGETPSVPSTYDVGARWRWSAGYLRRPAWGVFPTALRRGAAGTALRRDIFGSPGDFAPVVRDALWSVFDPMPAVLELAQACKDMVCGDLRSLRKRLVQDRAKPILQTGRIGRRDRAVYFAMRLLRALRRRRDQRRKNSPKAQNFLFICYGNIMRSPMCEALFLKNLEVSRPDGVSVISAGLNAVPGRATELRARKVATEFGISLEKHLAQMVTVEMVGWADIIFVMDFENEAHLLARYPRIFRKVFMLRSYDDNSNRQVEIPDPYWGDEAEVRACYRILDECIRNLVKTLSRKRQGSEVACRSAATHAKESRVFRPPLSEGHLHCARSKGRGRFLLPLRYQIAKDRGWISLREICAPFPGS